MTDKIEVSALWRLPKVKEVTSLGGTTIWEWVRAGRFPKPFKLSATVTVWRAVEVAAWIEARANGENPSYE